MSKGNPTPPRLASVLLGFCVPPGSLGDSLLGDLHEAYLNRVTPASDRGESGVDEGASGSGAEAAWRAALWYWGQVPRVGVRYLFRRVVHKNLYRSLDPNPGRPLGKPTRNHAMTDFGRDLRYSARSLRRSPGFLAASVLVLGIGIGAVSLMFSTFNTVVLQPLPFPEPDRLVWVWGSTESMPRNTISYSDVVDYRDGTDAFESIGASMPFLRTRVLMGDDGAEQVRTYFVSANLFDVLGASPQVGRLFLPEDEERGQDGVAILSHAFWQLRYGEDPGVIGTTIILDGVPAEVVGVMPADFVMPVGWVYPTTADMWFPLQRSAGYALGRSNNNFAVLGRLRDGVSLGQAQAQMDVVASGIAESYPEVKGGSWVTLMTLHERFFGPARTTLLILAGIISLVPLIACANVASLFMARAVTRRSEMASRLALGASRARVIRHLLTEGFVVALTGGAVGLVLAYLGGEALRSFAPGMLPRLGAIAIDGRVLAATLAAAFVMVPLFGLAPAIRGTDMKIAETLKAGGERGGGKRDSSFRSLLVVAQVSLSLMLMVASGLFVRSFLNLQSVDSGFRTESVLSLNALLPTFKYEARDEREQVWGEVDRRLRMVPGVRTVGFVDRLPLGAAGPRLFVWAAERPPASAAERVPATRRFASKGYFDALGIPLLAGRHLEEQERFQASEARGVVVINEALARQFFPGEDPLGKTLVLELDRPVDLEVVGVSADILETGPGSDPVSTFYLPARWGYDMLSVLLKTEGDPLDMAGAAREAIREVDDDITVSAVQTMQARLDNTLFQPRFRSAFVGIFSLVALILSSIGIYGVLAYFVRQHSHEISVRLALGSGVGGIARMVLIRGMTLVGVGILMGVSGALAGARLMQSWLFGIGAADPVTFVGVSLFLATVALLACIVPALRAAHLDPAEVMRAE